MLPQAEFAPSGAVTHSEGEPLHAGELLHQLNSNKRRDKWALRHAPKQMRVGGK